MLGNFWSPLVVAAALAASFIGAAFAVVPFIYYFGQWADWWLL